MTCNTPDRCGSPGIPGSRNSRLHLRSACPGHHDPRNADFQREIGCLHRSSSGCVACGEKAARSGPGRPPQTANRDGRRTLRSPECVSGLRFCLCHRGRRGGSPQKLTGSSDSRQTRHKAGATSVSGVPRAPSSGYAGRWRFPWACRQFLNDSTNCEVG